MCTDTIVWVVSDETGSEAYTHYFLRMSQTHFSSDCHSPRAQSPLHMQPHVVAAVAAAAAAAAHLPQGLHTLHSQGATQAARQLTAQHSST